MVGQSVTHANAARGKTLYMVQSGVQIAIFVFVFSLFVEIRLFDVGGLVVSLQKVAALILMPLAIAFMVRLKISRHLILFALLLALSYVAAYLIQGRFPAQGQDAVAVVGVGLAGGLVLYTAFKVGGTRAFYWFARVWLAFSVITAVTAILQSVHVLPLFNVPASALSERVAIAGLYRGVGFKFDPNFTAMALSIGVVFALVYIRTKFIKWTMVSLIFLGIVSTFSRTGLFVTVLIVCLHWAMELVRLRKRHLSLRLSAIFVGLACAALVVILSPSSPGKHYAADRFESIGAGLALLESGVVHKQAGNLSSAETRALLARGAFDLGVKNWPMGIGAYHTKSSLMHYVGVRNVAHDTYLEMLLIGGLLGVASMMYYAWIVVHPLVPRKYANSTPERRALILLICVFAFFALLLSLTYISIVWLPIVWALAYKDQRRYPLMESSEVGNRGSSGHGQIA